MQIHQISYQTSGRWNLHQPCYKQQLNNQNQYVYWSGRQPGNVLLQPTITNIRLHYTDYYITELFLFSNCSKLLYQGWQFRKKWEHHWWPTFTQTVSICNSIQNVYKSHGYIPYIIKCWTQNSIVPENITHITQTKLHWFDYYLCQASYVSLGIAVT